MPDFWVTFTGRAKPGSIIADSIELARDIAETKYGEAVRTIDPIPYPSFPILYRSGEPASGFEPRCSDPDRCKGKMFCQKRPACTE